MGLFVSTGLAHCPSEIYKDAQLDIRINLIFIHYWHYFLQKAKRRLCWHPEVKALRCDPSWARRLPPPSRLQAGAPSICATARMAGVSEMCYLTNV